MNSQEEQKAWKKVKYSQKFLNAFRGCISFGKRPDLYRYIYSAVAVVIAGFYFNVSDIEWIALGLRNWLRDGFRSIQYRY